MSISDLNAKQKRVAFGAAAVLILMFLCPPWYRQTQSQMFHEDNSRGIYSSSDRTHAMGLPLLHESFDGYHWLFAAPVGRSSYGQDYGEIGTNTYEATASGDHIAWGISFFQWLFVSLVTLALVHHYRDKPQVVSEPKDFPPGDKPNPELTDPNLKLSTETRDVSPDQDRGQSQPNSLPRNSKNLETHLGNGEPLLKK